MGSKKKKGGDKGLSTYLNNENIHSCIRED